MTGIYTRVRTLKEEPSVLNSRSANNTISAHHWNSDSGESGLAGRIGGLPTGGAQPKSKSLIATRGSGDRVGG